MGVNGAGRLKANAGTEQPPCPLLCEGAARAVVARRSERKDKAIMTTSYYSRDYSRGKTPGGKTRNV